MGARPAVGGRRDVQGALALLALLLQACTVGGAAPGVGAQPPEPAPGVQAPDPAEVEADLPVPAGVRLDTIGADPIGRGNLWRFDAPPRERIQGAYGFAPDSAWLRRLRLASLRLPGCSGAFVSAEGLVLTAHHCVREAIDEAEGPDEDLLAGGFLAGSREEERRLEGLHADQLLAVEDVTSELDGRLALAPASLQGERRAELQSEIAGRVAEAHGGPAAGIVVEVVSHYGGARTIAYVFRRHDDLRLVFAPEAGVAAFGGTEDNFAFPRHALDFALLRAYDDDGGAVAPEAHLAWSGDGADPGETVFSVMSPGATQRFETLDQLRFRRDASDAALLDLLRGRAEILEAFAEAHPEEARAHDLGVSAFDLRNAVQALEGARAGLLDRVVLARLEARDSALVAAVRADSTLAAADLVARLSELQTRRRRSAAGYAFLGLGAEAYESPTLRRALIAYQYENALRQAMPVRQREAILERLRAVGSLPAELDEALVADRLSALVEAFGPGSALALGALGGRTPEAAAGHIVATSVLADSARAAEAVGGGLVPEADPALAVVRAYAPELARFEQAHARADAEERALTERLARALHAVYGDAVPPEASLTPRVTDGVVAPPATGGAEAFTTFQGMYALHDRQGQGSSSPWRLPERWVAARGDVDAGTPLDFTSTLDAVGGSSGGPVVDRELGLVGVVFDVNRDALAGPYLYRPALARTVALDVRAILEALTEVYGAEALASELAGRALTGAGAPPP